MSRRRALGLLLALAAAPIVGCGRKAGLEPPPSKDETEKNESKKPAGP